MGKIFQPQTQVKLTNVSIVKLKTRGKRFELACYKNKVQEFRNGVEKDLENVLQINSVFTNVQKGQLAAVKDLAVFGEMTNDEIILEILKKGELQVSDKERKQVNDELFKDICTIISEKTVDTVTKRPFTTTIIEKVLQELHFNMSLTKNAKQQALDGIRLIQESGLIPIQRVSMKVSCSGVNNKSGDFKTKVLAIFNAVESQEWAASFEIVFFVNLRLD